MMAYVEGHEKMDIGSNSTELLLVLNDLVAISHVKNYM